MLTGFPTPRLARGRLYLLPRFPVSRSARPLGQLDVLGFDVIGWRQIAPVESALLAIGLAQGDRELGLHELPTQIEGVAGLVDSQLREDLLDVRPPDEDLVIEDRDSVPVGEDPEIRDL